MDKTKIVFGIGIALSVLAVLTAPAVADNYFYLAQQNNSCDGPGCTTTVMAMLHTDMNNVGSFGTHLRFIPATVNITKVERPTTPAWMLWDCKYRGEYVYFYGSDFVGVGPGELELGKLTLEGMAAGGSPLEYANWYPNPDEPTALGDTLGAQQPFTAMNGTFTCVGAEETFSEPLVTGWNLISLPLTATDMTVSNVIDTSLGGSYDELYRYDASMNSYAPVGSSDTMANGIGYFINMTTEDTWTYSGTAYGVMNYGYSDGLNMIGWLNCTKDISTTGLDNPAKTYYISRWDATKQEYKTYNPVASGDFNDFTELVRGEGYFISMTTDGTLSESC